MIKKIIVGLFVLGMLAVGYAYLQYTKGHRNIADEEASIAVTAVALFDAYSLDEVSANATYLDHVVAVSGDVLELDLGNSMVVLKTNDDFGTINASFDEGVDLSSLKVGDKVVVKGHCTGGDDLGVVLTHCSRIK